MKKIFIFLSLIIIAGCTWVGTVENVKTLHTKGTINPSASYFMIYPKNGTERSFFTQAPEENKDSAAEVSSVFYNKFHKHLGSLTVTENNISLEEGFKQANLRGDNYLISMDIHDWKDAFYMSCRGTNNQNVETNSAAFDSLDVSIRIYDVKTKALLNDQRLQNSGCPMVILAFIPIGKMSPSSRFDESLNVWFKSLN